MTLAQCIELGEALQSIGIGILIIGLGAIVLAFGLSMWQEL